MYFVNNMKEIKSQQTSCYLNISRAKELSVSNKVWRHHVRSEGWHRLVDGAVHGCVDEVHRDREDDGAVVLRRDAVEGLQVS